MGSLKIGVMIESFRLGVKKGIEKAAELRADGFQLFATSGEMAPENLSGSGRQDFLHFVEGGIEDLRLGDYFLEKPLGEGDVDFDGYIQAMKKIGYGGFFTIEREVGDNPVSDIVKATKFLERY